MPVMLAGAFLFVAGCGGGSDTATSEDGGSGAANASMGKVEVNQGQLAMFKPLPLVYKSKTNSVTDEKVTLGKMLYFEPRLSLGQDVSCNTCHGLDTYGVDNKPVSPGHKGQLGVRNSPTVYNAAGHFVQFWDGRSPAVEDQAKGPVLNPVEMAMPDEASVVKVLKSIPEYVTAFETAFPGQKDPVTFDNMANAIGAFERKLVTPSRWDDFLRGDKKALTNQEKAGFNAFVTNACTTCHMGPHLGANLYQKTGLIKPWPNQDDQGRAEVTENDGDAMMFKVPTLRNVAKTAPYFHDGSVADLGEAVKMMGEYQLGRTVSDEDVVLIVAWLNSLTGDLPSADLISPPELPASTDATPEPVTGD